MPTWVYWYWGPSLAHCAASDNHHRIRFSDILVLTVVSFFFFSRSVVREQGEHTGPGWLCWHDVHQGHQRVNSGPRAGQRPVQRKLDQTFLYTTSFIWPHVLLEVLGGDIGAHFLQRHFAE
jgi:hypothetical protein